MRDSIIDNIGTKALPAFVIALMLENHRKVSKGTCLIRLSDDAQYGECNNPGMECADCLKELKTFIGTTLLNSATKESGE